MGHLRILSTISTNLNLPHQEWLRLSGTELSGWDKIITRANTNNNSSYSLLSCFSVCTMVLGGRWGKTSDAVSNVTFTKHVAVNNCFLSERNLAKKY